MTSLHYASSLSDTATTIGETIYATGASVGDAIYNAGAAAGNWIGRTCTTIYESAPSRQEIAERMNTIWLAVKPFLLQILAFAATPAGTAAILFAIGVLFIIWTLNTDENHTAKKIVLAAFSAGFLIAGGMHAARA